MLKCDLCKGNSGITHLITIPLKTQQDRFGYVNHIHICFDCIKDRYPSEALEEISKVEEEIFLEVKRNKDENNRKF